MLMVSVSGGAGGDDGGGDVNDSSSVSEGTGEDSGGEESYDNWEDALGDEELRESVGFTFVRIIIVTVGCNTLLILFILARDTVKSIKRKIARKRRKKLIRKL